MSWRTGGPGRCRWTRLKFDVGICSMNPCDLDLWMLVFMTGFDAADGT